MGKVSDAPDSRRNAPVRDIITPVRRKNIPVADKNISVSVNAFFVIMVLKLRENHVYCSQQVMHSLINEQVISG